MSNSARYVCFNGELFEEGEPVLQAESKAVNYGAGCFETLLFSKGKTLHLDAHFDRLRRGADFLGVNLTGTAGLEQLRSWADELLKKNSLTHSDALVRIQLVAGGGRGYRRSGGENFDLIITADKVSKEHDRGYSLATVPTRVVPDVCRPADLKLSNTLHYMQAWRQANQAGADDGLMLTTGGYVAETSVSNIFWKRGNRIYTPSGECDILPGLLRGVVLKLLGQMSDFQVEQGTFKPELLQNAELIWVTNSVREILPVAGLDGRNYPVEDPFYELLCSHYQTYKAKHLC